MIEIKNKKILITGATGGIGGAIVKKLSGLGANIFATGTNQVKLKKLKILYPKIHILDFNISNHLKV